MRDVWSVAQIRAAEDEVKAGGPGGFLMARAAYGLAMACRAELGRGYGARVVLLVGAGHNGGDALYAGVHLLEGGAAVHAVLLAPDRVHAPGAAAFVRAGGSTGGPDGARARLDAADLVLDGITGIGGRGGLRPPADVLLDGLGTPVLAVDLPSGVDADTGHVAGAAVSARTTVTFGGLKTGLVVGAGRRLAGAVHLVDIGLGPHLHGPVAQILDDRDVAGLLPVAAPGDDKYTRGVVGMVSGSATYEGAAVLSTGGALRTKAGMVRYVGPAAAAVRTRWPESVVSTGRPSAAGRVQAWVIGPGLGTAAEARSLVAEVMATDLPVLADADALTILGREPDLVRGRAAPTVLTPHDREFERLAGPVGEDRIGAARRAAVDLGVTVLLKGQATVVAGSDGRVLVNPTGSSWLATAGTGDVLAGIGGALLAAGLRPVEAAAAAAYLHGAAGARAANRKRPGPGAPIVAMDVVDALPATIAALLGTLPGA